MDNDNTVFTPDALLAEVCSPLSLHKAFFAMPPRWLKLVEHFTSCYSSITFVISDPDGPISSILLKGRIALFRKEVKIQKWIDKPVPIQCFKCHALGHSRASKACLLSRDSVKCYICGSAHRSEKYNQYCPHKHAVAGTCDCIHYRCLNCHKFRHHYHDKKCLAQSLF